MQNFIKVGGAVWSILFLSLAFGWEAQAKTVEKCGDFGQLGLDDAKYCLVRETESKNQSLVYLLHGLGHTEKTWRNMPEAKGVLKIWQKTPEQVPTIVSISYGRQWLATSTRIDQLYNQIIPHIDQMVSRPIKRRILFGSSMGGHNAFQLYLRRPKHFDQVAITCPALANLSPWASMKELSEYRKRTGAKWTFIGAANFVARREYKTLENWNRSEPMSFLKSKFKAPATPDQIPFYIGAASKDQYGFQEGAVTARDVLKKRGVAVEWKMVKGGHCRVDHARLAKFLEGEEKNN